MILWEYDWEYDSYFKNGTLAMGTLCKQIIHRNTQKIANRLQSIDRLSFKDIVTWLSFKKHNKSYINYADPQEHDSCNSYKNGRNMINSPFTGLDKRIGCVTGMNVNY